MSHSSFTSTTQDFILGLEFLHFWLGGGGLNELKELDLGS
jgi:hypothetical protein